MRKSTSERKTGTRVDTITFTREEAAAWESPGFQRALRVNNKVKELAGVIAADGGVVPGILSFGKLNGTTYLIDGQHRREAFLLSEKKEGYADVRICEFQTMAEMGREFVDLNSRLVSMKPDDVLRGLESSSPILTMIRESCQFIGYDSIRRNDRAPVLSMSMAIRAWATSAADVPSGSSQSAATILESMHTDDAKELIAYFKLAFAAWGRDASYIKLWGSLNLIITMWLYRRLVLWKSYSAKTKRMSDSEFRSCLTALSADGNYLDWLVGRLPTDRDRAPAYARVKAIFAKRIQHDTGHKALLPAPAWSHG